MQRLTTENTQIKWVVYGAADGLATTPFTYFVSDDEPVDNYLLAIKHMECFNDGIKISFHAEQKDDFGVVESNDKITLTVFDAQDEIIFEFFGSLKRGSKDDYGQSDFLTDLISRMTDSIIVETDNIEMIKIDSAAYGYF